MENLDSLAAQNPLSMLGGSLFTMSIWGILASVLFSTLGLFYFKRGKAASDTPLLTCGVLLLVYPYFVSETLYIVLIGAGLAAAPYLIKKL